MPSAYAFTRALLQSSHQDKGTRTMHPDLRSALEKVLADLQQTTDLEPDVRDKQWSEVEGQETAYLYSPDGSGMGVYVLSFEPPLQQLVQLADQVQEWVLAELRSQQRPVTWPECPDHPNSHPLEPLVVVEEAVWVCPRTEKVVARVGSLQG